MKSRIRIIIATVICTTMFWIAVVVGVFWLGGEKGVRIQFDKPGTMDVLSGAYRVDVITSNTDAASLLLSYTARAPERVFFMMKPVNAKTAQR